MDKDALEVRLGLIRDSLGKDTKLVPRKYKNTLGQQVITKWRYRKKAYNGSSMLSDKCKSRVQLFDDLVQESSDSFPEFRLHDTQALLERIRLIQNHTRLLLVEWDVRWVNPPSLASKGWKPYQGRSHPHAVFKCCCCHAIMSLQSSKNDDISSNYNKKLNEKIWLSNVVGNHLQQCPWGKKQFDLDKEYYLNPQNLITDIERIHTDVEKFSSESKEFHLKRNSSRIFHYLTEIEMKKLAHFFNCKDYSLVGLLLLGYTKFEKDDLVQCTACFHRASLRMLEHIDFNGHALWCRYYSKKLLSKMLLELIDKKDNAITTMGVGERLNKLETVLQIL
ncbi:YML107C [Saccharomyces arboricola H-6]|uniref:YML107C n=1 Tax=Saccharomyces arboricola (strain H-6 / AS 2.3317 / CBS 10644) TaxID=1160507 RepID=J8Q1F3_SACAR|nr:YML107C [Saccharomyces arboricola H-6]